MQVKLYKALYRNLVNYASVAGVDESALQKYFIPEGNTNSVSILFRLCSSLQNSGMMRNSIKFNDKDCTHRNTIKKVLFGFDTKNLLLHTLIGKASTTPCLQAVLRTTVAKKRRNQTGRNTAVDYTTACSS